MMRLHISVSQAAQLFAVPLTANLRNKTDAT